MSKLEKAKERIKKVPKDYTFQEARSLLLSLGFMDANKGKTSGSRVRFYREDNGLFINLHKPHPGDIMKEHAVKQLVEFLRENGYLK